MVRILYFSLGFILISLIILSINNLFLKSPIDNFKIGEKAKLADSDTKSGFSPSPEKERIAYIWKDNLWIASIYGEKRQLIEIKNMVDYTGYQDGKLVTVYTPRQSILNFAWSPTEDKILCEVQEKTDKEIYYVIWIVDVMSGDKYILQGTRPSWSPNGKMIAYLLDGDIWIAKKGIDNRWIGRRITDIPERVSSYSWSPDGKKIGFTIGDNKGLFVLDIATREIQKLTYYGDEYLHGFQWLPTGDKIIYHSRKDGKVWEKEVNGPELKPFIRDLFNLSWSADGKRGAKVVFEIGSDGGFKNHLITIDVEKRKIISSIFTSQQAIPGVPFQFEKLVWFQDGRIILLFAQLDGKKGLYVADVEKKKMHLLLEDEGIQNYVLLPDERKIIFSTSKGQSSGIWMATLLKD